MAFSAALLGFAAHGRCYGPVLSHAMLATATRVRTAPPTTRPFVRVVRVCGGGPVAAATGLTWCGRCLVVRCPGAARA
eukprot:3930454-Alexandrium_andersonii.AAC.1